MKEYRRRSNKKCLAYIAAFVVIQAIVIAVFALTVMRIKSPKVRFGSLAVGNFSSSNNSSPSFSMRLNAQVAVKNPNFGHFKYENSTITILYGGKPVGEALIEKGRAGARKTKRFNVVFDISSDRLTGSTNLANDMNSGLLQLSSQAKLSGKVHLIKVIKKKKSGEMACMITVNLMMRQVQDVKCK